MKKIFYLMFIGVFAFTACNSDNTKVTKTEKNDDGTTTKTEVDVKGMTSAADEMTQRLEALKKLKPLTIEEMKALLPEEMDGVKQSNYNATATMGYAFVGVEYDKKDRSELKVNLYDCAGEMGAGFYSATYWTGMNFQQENENEYTKTIDFMGGRAIENYKKEQNNSTLTYIVGDRLLVVLEGRDMKPEELKAAAEKLNLKL